LRVHNDDVLSYIDIDIDIDKQFFGSRDLKRPHFSVTLKMPRSRVFKGDMIVLVAYTLRLMVRLHLIEYKYHFPSYPFPMNAGMLCYHDRLESIASLFLLAPPLLISLLPLSTLLGNHITQVLLKRPSTFLFFLLCLKSTLHLLLADSIF